MAPEPGAARSEDFYVDGPLLTNVGGAIEASVLSTPAMIGMMEHCSTMLVAEGLEDGQATVGFEVCVKHVAGALKGSSCTVSSTLREVIEDRKLRFDVEVAEGDRTIGVGTHERRVIAANLHT
jgi:predicted thioesterase